MTAPKPDNIAPDGYLWVCHACGKTETDRYGEKGGWDESCMLNCALHKPEDLMFNEAGTRVISIAPHVRLA